MEAGGRVMLKLYTQRKKTPHNFWSFEPIFIIRILSSLTTTLMLLFNQSFNVKNNDPTLATTSTVSILNHSTRKIAGQINMILVYLYSGLLCLPLDKKQ